MSQTTAQYRIWIISDGNPGHFNQSLAISELVSERRSVVTEWIDARLKVRGFLRPLLAALLNVGKLRFPEAAIKLLYALPDQMPEGTPNLIISSGGKTAFLNVILARRTASKNLFIGTPPGITCENFTSLLMLENDPRCANWLLLDSIPTRVTPEKTAALGRQFKEQCKLEGAQLWCMLIGGASRSHRYTAEDWRQLALAMNALAEKHDIKWLVTTSRRTGRACEEVLSKTLKPEIVAEAAYWGIEPRKVVLAYLGASDVVFSTQDSLTMITEAMASGKPAYAVYPKTVHLAHDSARFYKNYLERNIELGRLRVAPISELTLIDVQYDLASHFSPTKVPLTAKIAVALHSLLEGECHVKQ